MMYVKPSIASLGPASAAIQHHAVKGTKSTDANQMEITLSTGDAYDLDE